MMKRNFLIATALLALPLTMAASSQNGTGETDGYKLVWQDLFDADELNLQRWNIEVNGDGGGNNELQYYTDRVENVRLGDDGKGNGCLILTAVKESYGGRPVTSGRINSKNKIAFKHGKIEAAIKLPKTANGLWPAFWMMGNDFDQVGWPRCGETDIMEFGNATGIKNGTQDRYFNGACHWGQSWENHPNYARAVTYEYSLQDDEFHIYTLIWDENQVAMYVDLDKYPDAEPYYVMTIPASNDTNSPGYYFHKENFILFNLAVGGNFPGIWNINQITALNESNGYQASMYVDYVKIYQKGTADESSSFLEKGDIDNAGVETVAVDLTMNYNGRMLNFSDKADVEVYDIAGKVVTVQKAVETVSVADFVPGIYVVKAVCNGKQLVEKIVCK